MSDPATLSGTLVTRALLTVPVRGVWHADVELAEAVTVSGAATMSLGGVDWVGTVERGSSWLGESGYTLTGGGGGWGDDVPARSYHDPAGIRLSTVLADAAREAGETLASGMTESLVGSDYVRPAGPAASVLDGRTWHVGADGKTVVDERESAAAPSGYVVSGYDPLTGRVELAVESLVGIVPSATVDVLETGTVVLGELVVELSGSSLSVRSRAQRAEAETDNPIADALSAMVRRAVRKHLGLPGVYHYRVAMLDGDLLHVQPIDAGRGLPVLMSVRVMPGISGASSSPSLGSECVVAFLDGNRTKPVVVGFVGIDGVGYVPDELSLEGDSVTIDAATTIDMADSLGPVIRVGDTITLADGSTGVIVFTPTLARPIPSRVIA